MHAVGVDGCRAGWAFALEVSGNVQIQVFERLEQVLDRPDLNRIAIDMPIGLPEGKDRVVESLARARLGSRKASVFNVPASSAVYAKSFEEACALNVAAKGKKISLQSWYLCPKIKELDALIRRDETLKSRVFEAHPELIFAALNGSPMADSKKREVGQLQRINVLKKCGIPADRVVEAVYQNYRKSDLQVDDVLDALVLFWVAKTGGQPIAADAVIDEFGIPANLLVPERSIMEYGSSDDQAGC